MTFHDVPRRPWTIDRASLMAQFVVHPGPTVGYRIATKSSSFAYIPDHEPALAGAITGRSPDWISGASLASGVDALVHDAQYFEDEYEERIGWVTQAWRTRSLSRTPFARADWCSSTTSPDIPTACSSN